MKLPAGLLQELPEGLRILGLQQALAEPSLSKELEVLAGSLELTGTSHVFEALNTAGMNSALIIHVAENTDAGRLTLDWFQHAAKTARIDNVRVFVFLEAGAQLQLQETFFSSNTNSGQEGNSAAAVCDSMINQVTQISLADGAALDHLRVQAASESQHLFLFASAQQASKTEYRYSGFEMGGGLVRNGLISRLEGAGAKVDLAAAFIGNGESCIDHHVLAEHIATGCSSEQNFRGVLGGRSRGVFNGKAIIRPGADGSSVRQSNANMLLSDLAEMNTKPELEIYADEVEASHGATVGQLDEQALFYMVSRGIAAEDARRMLTGAFCRSIGNRLSDRKLAEQIEVLLDRAMPVLSWSGNAK
jgi:Fe-S cluster assembly protein SufD